MRRAGRFLTKRATACSMALERYVAGEVKTNRSWLPNDGYYLLSEKLIALEALSRYDRASSGLLDTVRVDPVKLTAASLADWIDILNRSKDVPNRDAQRAAAIKELRDNIRVASSVATITRSDDRWYFMRSDDYTMARMFRLSMDARELANSASRCCVVSTTACSAAAISTARRPISGLPTRLSATTTGGRRWSHAHHLQRRDEGGGVGCPPPKAKRHRWTDRPGAGGTVPRLSISAKGNRGRAPSCAPRCRSAARSTMARI